MFVPDTAVAADVRPAVMETGAEAPPVVAPLHADRRAPPMEAAVMLPPIPMPPAFLDSRPVSDGFLPPPVVIPPAVDITPHVYVMPWIVAPPSAPPAGAVANSPVAPAPVRPEPQAVASPVPPWMDRIIESVPSQPVGALASLAALSAPAPLDRADPMPAGRAAPAPPPAPAASPFTSPVFKVAVLAVLALFAYKAAS